MSMFKTATKKKAKARVALIGPPGSGKTFTALRIAAHLGGKIAVIDTERLSASKYAKKRDADGNILDASDPNTFDFQVCEPQTFEPKSYIRAIEGAAAEGFPVLIIDSMSHAWEGEGGILDQVDKRGGKFDAWRDMSPQTRQLIEAILTYPGHVIATMRVKTEWVVEKNSQGKMEPRNVGLAPKFKDGLEYEFDVVGMLDDANTLRITKSRCVALSGTSISKAGKSLADSLLAWLDDGAETVKPAAKPATAAPGELAAKLFSGLDKAQTPKEGAKAKQAIRDEWKRLTEDERKGLADAANAWHPTADEAPANDAPVPAEVAS